MFGIIIAEVVSGSASIVSVEGKVELEML